MPPEQKLSYSSQVAPYLLSFSGSPAERFVEDLKVCPIGCSLSRARS